MVKETALILGGSFGGLTAAHHLRRLLPTEHRIVVVEKTSTFYIRAFNMRLITGEMKHPQEGERDLSGLARKGIEWVHGEVLEIDPQQRRAHTSSGALEGDYIIIALGAERPSELVPGFAQSAYNLYDASGALQLRKALDEFEGGRIVILICSTPFSCPAAPYEAAFLLDSEFKRRGNRQRVEIAIYTPEMRPMPSAGPGVGSAVISMLQERNIEFHPKQKPQRIDDRTRQITFDGEQASFDLLVGIPPHVAPEVVRKAGLTDETGWVPVDIQTLETRHPGVFAIGDITSIRQPNPTGLFLPKAWVFADAQGRVVAENISAQIRRKDKLNQFDGKGFCYIEVGDGLAAYGSGDFYAYPEPRVYLEPASQRYHKERRELEQERLETLA